MPPWKPEPGDGEFVGAAAADRRARSTPIAAMDRAAARPKAIARDLPPPPGVAATAGSSARPISSSAWPRRTSLPADGGDVFRTFVHPDSGRRGALRARHRVPAGQRARRAPRQHRRRSHALVAAARRSAIRSRATTAAWCRRPAIIRTGICSAGRRASCRRCCRTALAWRLEPGSDLVVAAAPAADRQTPKRCSRASACSSPTTPPTRTPVDAAARQRRPSTSRRRRRTTWSTDRTCCRSTSTCSRVQPHAHYPAREMEAIADAARRHAPVADLDHRLGLPLAGRLPLRRRRSRCRRARRSRCATPTTTPPATRATRISRRGACAGARTASTRWAICGFRCCRAPLRPQALAGDFGPKVLDGRCRRLRNDPPGRSRQPAPA